MLIGPLMKDLPEVVDKAEMEDTAVSFLMWIQVTPRRPATHHFQS